MLLIFIFAGMRLVGAVPFGTLAALLLALYLIDC